MSSFHVCYGRSLNLKYGPDQGPEQETWQSGWEKDHQIKTLCRELQTTKEYWKWERWSSTEKSTPTDDIWITKSSAMKASKKKSTDNVKQDSDSTNKLPHKFSTWQKYHLWFMFQYMNFGRAYYLPVLLISVRFNYSIFPAV